MLRAHLPPPRGICGIGGVSTSGPGVTQVATRERCSRRARLKAACRADRPRRGDVPGLSIAVASATRWSYRGSLAVGLPVRRLSAPQGSKRATTVVFSWLRSRAEPSPCDRGSPGLWSTVPMFRGEEGLPRQRFDPRACVLH